MQVRQLLQDDDAVSPVIGVILMVAITVILAAVIASFVLGLGGSQQQTPQASFSWDFEEVTGNSSNGANGQDNTEGVLEVSHDGGDTIPANELQFRGEGFVGGSNKNFDGDSTNDPDADIVSSGQWPGSETNAEQGDQSAVTGGDNVDIGTVSTFEISLVWEPQEGDTSATLSEKTGPDA